MEIRITDTIRKELLNKTIQLKNNHGYGTLHLDNNNIILNGEKAFIAKEIGYGVTCGFLFIPNNKKDYFENSRIVYKKIKGNWCAYIYYN